MRRHPTIAAVRASIYPWNLRGHGQWPRPPDLVRKKYDCIHSAEPATVPCEHAHFLEKRLGFESELFLRPRRLQRKEVKAATAEETA